ncbi:ATP-binding protein [Sinosporangium siamense]|nr:tetratricopeptide repeat protein [Sinosporangium siamense]
MSGHSRDVVQAGNVSGGVHFYGQWRDKRQGGRTPRQLLAAIKGFVNRTDELGRLNAALAEESPTHSAVYVIVGTAGVGKTSLALQWANQAQSNFPDGQLYINLRGYDPGEPVKPEEALHRFLSALGVPSAAVPRDRESAAAMYRSELADRRMLIVLDNAATVSQVRPLLPGNSHCLTVVTSRSRLSGLAVHNGAVRLKLDALIESECVVLLRTLTAEYRPHDDTEELVQLAALCARLPLALRVAAERAVCRPHMRLDELIADLRDTSALWNALSTGDDEDEGAVRSVFAWSYRALSIDCARMFRLLGLHPGADFGIGAAASLAEVSIRQARHLLDSLVAAHMVEQKAPDRYEFHDLLRAYARDQALLEETPESRLKALERVLDWYIHMTDAAQVWIMPKRERIALDLPHNGVSTPFLTYDQAVDWTELEQSNFLPVVHAALQAALDKQAWQLSLILWSTRPPTAVGIDWIELGQLGLQASRRLNDRAGEAGSLKSLGFTYASANQLAKSVEHHEAALAVYVELGDRQGEAAALNAIGITHLRSRDLPAAERRLRQAGLLFESLGSTYWSAVVSSNLASVYYHAGRLEEADEVGIRALNLHRELGNKNTIGNALYLRSCIHLDRGELEQALEAAQEAYEIALSLRSHALEGFWLLALGDAQHALGRGDEALVSYQRSAVLHRRSGNRSREALAWQAAGRVYHRGGRHGEAADFHRQAAVVQRELGFRWHEATALEDLAEALSESDADAGREQWRRALGLISDYSDPRALRMRQRIRERLGGE